MTQENFCIGIKTYYEPAPALKSVDINGRLDGLLLEMRIRQRYCNEADEDIEAVYTFPLAWGAQLLGLDVEIGGKKLRGAVTPREQARKKYEDAIEKGDTPVMVEQSSDGIFTANLGNLRPGDEAVLDLRYAQLLRFEQGHVRLSVPTVIAPRYGDEHQDGALAPHETTGASLAADYPLTLAIDLCGDIAAAAQVSSPSHPVVIRDMPGGCTVTLATGATLDRDFVLVLNGLDGKTFALAAVDNLGGKSRKPTVSHTVLASFCPSVPSENRTPLSLKILVDCSGSMEGDSIRSAREALHRVLASLDPHDYVSFSRFGSNVEHESRRVGKCTPATIRRIAKAVTLTDANLGGTEMGSALLSTFRNIAPPAADNILPPAVLLITDGEIWKTGEVIAEARRSEHRIFAVGVGSSPAENLLRELAEQTDGACEMVAPNENTANAIVRMFHRLRNATAVDVRVDWGAKPVWQSAPPHALYDGETVHIFAQFAKLPSHPPRLRWEAAGTAHTLNAQNLSIISDDSLPRLAGAKKMNETGTDNLRKKLAMTYQLVSAQTNLFLVHIRASEDKAGSLPMLHQVPQMLAAGWGGTGAARGKQIMCGKVACKISAAPAQYAPEYYNPESHHTQPVVRKCAPVKSLKSVAFTLDEAREVARATSTPIPGNKLVENFSALALNYTNFAAIIARLSAIADANAVSYIADIARKTNAASEEVWAVLLDNLIKAEQAHFTPSRQAVRLLRQRLKSISKTMRQAIIATSEFKVLAGGTENPD